jgi:hypothetical protein
MSAPETSSSAAKTVGWVEPVVWSLVFVAAIVIAAIVSEAAREIILQGLAYLFTFFSTPFVLEASVAFIGLCIVFIVNSRRIAREGDGWVVMEVKKTDAAAVDAPAEKSQTEA